MKRLVLAALLACSALAACGGDAETGTSSERPPAGTDSSRAQARYDARALAVCRQAVEETRRLGETFLRSGGRLDDRGGLVLTTEGLVEPGLDVRRRMAARFRRLGEPPHPSEALEAYLSLFDPIEVLIEMRLRSGRAGDAGEASRVEQLAQRLGEEQRTDARIAGLDACAIDFVKVAFSASHPR